MSMISDLVDRLRAESKSMGEYGVDYMATLLMRAADTIEILSEKGKADRPQGEWIEMYRNGFGNMICMCSKCSFHASRSRYCPNCGARMKGEGDDI